MSQPNDIIIDAGSFDIQFETEPIEIEVAATGAPGPQGPPGPPGESGVTSVVVQDFTSATTSWVMVHNFNTPICSVSTTSLDGKEQWGDVSFPDANTARVDWYYPTTGRMKVRK